MTVYVLVLVIVAMLMAGWYGRKLWQAGDDVRSLEQRLENARRARWRVRRVAAVVGFALVTMWMYWRHVNGGLPALIWAKIPDQKILGG